MFKTKREILFTILAGFFVTNAVVGELIGGKLINIFGYTLSMGIIPWPVVFLTTDVINEYYGRNGVRRLTFMTVGLIVYTFIILFVSMLVPASKISPVTDSQFYSVFGQSLWIIIGSITAFLASQLLDVIVFWLIRQKTGESYIWLRSTGSTLFSQLIDTFIVTGIAFWLPGKIGFGDYVSISANGYTAKLVIAVALTPLIYVMHGIVHKYLGEEEAKRIVEQSAKESEGKFL